MFETGTAAEVRAFHVMPGLPPPEGQRHAHDYRLEVVVRRDELDERGMVVDLDALGGALAAAVGVLSGADLDRLIGEPLGLPAVTVEHFAAWLHGQIATELGPLPGTALGVRVWETPLAFGGYTAPVSSR
jgi:6-pyruvoyltetrahydropterin/6-carboxytetrahydropterin synthase